VVDPYTVQVVLKQPDATFMQKLAFTSPAAMLSPKTVTKETVQETEKVTDVTGTSGTGPYMIAKYVPDQYVLLTAYPKYWGEAPKTKNILIKFYPDASALALAMRSGEIDIAWRSLNPDDLNAFAKDASVQTVKGGGGLSVRYLVFQTQLAPFDNVDVRKGLSLAVDRDELIAKAFAGYNSPAYTMVPPGLPYSEATYPGRDLAQAKALLTKAGYTEQKPLEMNLWFDSSGHYSSKEPDVAALIKNQLEATGLVQVTLQPLDWGAMTQKRQEASMGVYLLGWYPDYLDADDYITPFVKSPDNEWLGNRYNDAAMNDLVAQASLTTDDAKRAALYQQIQTKMAEQSPLVPLWFNTLQNYAVAKPGVSGILLPPDMEIRLARLASE
ncbi:MAG TPA: ABC transporter substrate-binding protein, partial [Limnochordia bacterium]|nr:ABC transporter substrate-binding protein [Limnochordia bacterium]